MIKLLELPRIEESAELVERVFRQFRAQQTIHGAKVTCRDKQELRRKLTALDDELDRYLAGEYGVRATKRKDFHIRKTNHHPFHWFVEFRGIMRAGGSDVVIGNPPYVEYNNIRSDYTVRGFESEQCGDLYAFCAECALRILCSEG